MCFSRAVGAGPGRAPRDHGDTLHWTTHVVTGAAVGYLIGRPIPAAAAGFSSHLLLDTFPHADPDLDISYVADSLVGAAFLTTLAVSKRLRHADRRHAGLVGGIAAGLPDLELLAKLVTTVHEEDYLYPTHNGRIPHRQTGMLISVLTQGALIALTVGLALLKWWRTSGGQSLSHIISHHQVPSRVRGVGKKMRK